MAYYRTGTYVAFHADGKRAPTESDIKYYRLLQAWNVRASSDFNLVDSHEKTAALRDSSSKATVEQRLKDRLRRSKNMILIIGRTTHLDTDWVPMEIEYAIDNCAIPIIATYTGYERVQAPNELRHLWPTALARRIDRGVAHVIHVPFKQQPLQDAVGQFSHNSYPSGGGLGIYNDDAYRSWGLLK